MWDAMQITRRMLPALYSTLRRINAPGEDDGGEPRAARSADDLVPDEFLREESRHAAR